MHASCPWPNYSAVANNAVLRILGTHIVLHSYKCYYRKNFWKGDFWVKQ